MKWRVGRTTGGALGVWSDGRYSDGPDVCVVASVPSRDDVKRADLIARAPEMAAALREACEIIKECDGVLRQLYEDDDLYERISAFLEKRQEKKL